MYRRQWEGRLENFVPGDLPDFDDADAELREILAAVFGSNADASRA
jgi:hypothetical protein